MPVLEEDGGRKLKNNPGDFHGLMVIPSVTLMGCG